MSAAEDLAALASLLGGAGGDACVDLLADAEATCSDASHEPRSAAVAVMAALMPHVLSEPAPAPSGP